MKKNILTSILAILTFISFGQKRDEFKFNIVLSDADNAIVELHEANQNSKPGKLIASFDVKNGGGTFTHKLNKDKKVIISTKEDNVNTLFILEKGQEYKVRFVDETVRVIGGLAREIEKSYIEVSNKFREENDACGNIFFDASKRNDKKVMYECYDEFAAQNVRREERAYKIFKKYPDNLASIDFMLMNSRNFTYAFMKKLYDQLSDESKKYPGMDEYRKEMEQKKKTAIGFKAPNFTLKTPEGKEFSLYDLKGKVKVIDFWASWCGPCRLTNKGMVEIYEKYHKKGLECLSVSLDEYEDAWKKAVKEDGLPWTNVSSMKGFECSAAKMFNVEAIPFVMVLDENNIILGKQMFEPHVLKIIEKKLK